LKNLRFFAHFSVGTAKPDEKSTNERRGLTQSTLADRMQLKILIFGRIVRCKPSKIEQK